MSKQEYYEFHESYTELHEPEEECPVCLQEVRSRDMRSYKGRPMCDRCLDAAEFYDDEIKEEP